MNQKKKNTKKGEQIQKYSVGQSKKEVSIEVLKRLCKVQYTTQEILAYCEVSEPTLLKIIREYGYKNFLTFKKAFAYQGTGGIKALQWRSMKNGNVAMQIWLGKQYLGQKDKLETENTNINKEPPSRTFM